MFKKLTTLTLGLCLSMSALAVDVATLTKKAESGDVDAQGQLADYYEKKQDYANQFYWTQKLANQGIAPAQFNLGKMYDKGDGIRQDYKKAIYWYLKSANQGNAKAQFNLALRYYNGQGVSQNKLTAGEWFKKACENGEQQGCENYKSLNGNKY